MGIYRTTILKVVAMKVAIIGAGFSGMLAAYLLEREGIKVTIYEQQEFIGGHCRTLSSKDEYTELGTVFSFTKHIKELLIELQVDYTERFSYKNFVDEHYANVEHISRSDIALLMAEMPKLRKVLDQYAASLNEVNYGYIPEVLMMPLSKFLDDHNFVILSQVIAPHLSSFGFGHIDTVQAYYVFKVFNVDVLDAFIRGDKLLFISKGTSELIRKLSQNISDIRYSLEVVNVEVIDDKVKIDTVYGSDYYDKVLITTKLPQQVIKDNLYNQLMMKVDTNPFIACAYEVADKNLVTTYYKSNLGKKRKLQFFYTSRQHSKTKLIAYAYGHIERDLINEITQDIEALGITINQLITVKQWYIFPHLNSENLTQHFYEDITRKQKNSNICMIGSLVSVPSIDNLYISVKQLVNEIVHYSQQ